MTELEKLIENSTHQITDENGNKWKVIETSDLEDIMEAYHQHELKEEKVCNKCNGNLGEDGECLNCNVNKLLKATDHQHKLKEVEAKKIHNWVTVTEGSIKLIHHSTSSTIEIETTSDVRDEQGERLEVISSGWHDYGSFSDLRKAINETSFP